MRRGHSSLRQCLRLPWHAHSSSDYHALEDTAWQLAECRRGLLSHMACFALAEALSAGHYCAQMIALELESSPKIREVTLMRPIHGNL